MPPTAPDKRDEQLALLFEQLTDAAKAGDHPYAQSLLESHPELADELRDLWGMLMVTGALAEAPPNIDSQAATPAYQISAERYLPCSFGPFELREELGRGGMGVVYRAYQASLDREVAVKLILSGSFATADDRQRFRSEAEAAARLVHPGIVPIFEVGECEGQCYFSMPMLLGSTLGAKLAAGPMACRDAAKLVRDVALAIDYAHQRGVVHRDLKPANILLDRLGRPHVTDFGLAKRVGHDHPITRTGAVLGTPAYMAPEQAAGSRGETGPVSDVYSLGAILYALLTARPPFQGPTPVDTVLMVLEQEPLPPRLLNARVDRDLEMIVLRCLQKPVELRYASAADLASDLNAFLAGEPIAARSGRFSHVVARVFAETHHATVLENWGLLWIWHSLVLLVICLVTNWFHLQRDAWSQMATPIPYLLLWGGGLAVWAPIFWRLRHRSGPVTAVERQIAHVWAGSMISVMLLFVIEYLLHLPVLRLSPVLGLVSGAVFVVKAGILSGAFYVHAAALFLTSLVMAEMDATGCPYGITLYGLVSAATFFVPGLKYYRQSQLAGRC